MRRLCAFLLALVALGGVMAPVSFVPYTAAPTHLGAFRNTPEAATNLLPGQQGVPFLPDVLTGARLVVLIRFGSNWTDVSTDTIHELPASITPGRPNEAGVAPPARATLTLKNPDRRYSQFDPLSPNWPYVRENALLWVRLFMDGQYYTRFYGEIKGWKQVHDTSGNYSVVTITAAGVTQRLGLRTAPLKSALYRAYLASNPTAWWTLEDSSGASQAASPLTGVQPMTLSAQGLARFAGIPGPGGAATAVDLSSTGVGGDILQGRVPINATATSWRVEFGMLYRTTDAAYQVVMSGWSTTGGVTTWYMDANPVSPTGLRLNYLTSDGTFGALTGAVEHNDGQWHLYTITGTKSGADIAVTVAVDGVTVISGTVAGRAFGAPWEVSGQAGISTTNPVTTGMSHIVVWAPASAASTYPAFTGYSGETPAARLARVCAEEGIPFSTVDYYSSSATMGPQGADPLMGILRECELADAGFLYDGLSEGLRLQGISQRYDQFSRVTFDASAGEVVPPFEPLPDDYGRANRVTVNRKNGGSDTAEDVTGPLGSGVVGTYDASLPQPVNYADDTPLLNRASWEVHKGSGRPGFRYPTVSLNLRKTPSKILSGPTSGWLTMTPGLMFTVLPPYLAQNPSEAIRLVAEGWTELLSSIRWEATVNCSRQDVYDVFKIGDTRLGRLRPAGASLSADAATGATTLTVTSTGAPWIDSATNPSLFPFDAEISGVQVTVTAVAGTSSPQTFTVTGVTKDLHAGDAVKLWRPGVLKL